MVTAVITTYKREPKMVERALKSILAQTYSPIEVVVVDDSPAEYEKRDAVEKMISTYCMYNVRYVKHEKNLGACAARNTGLKYALGEYIAFLDDDDEWMSQKIEKQIQVMKNNKNITALVYCGQQIVNESTHQTIIPEILFLRGWIFERLIEKNFIGSTSFPLIRTECLREVGGFDEEMPAAQDYDVWLRLAKNYNIDYVAEPLVKYYIHKGECITGNPKKKLIALKRINAKYETYLRSNNSAYWNRNMRMIDSYVASGQRRDAFRIWLKAVVRKPLRVVDNCKYLVLVIFYDRKGRRFRR